MGFLTFLPFLFQAKGATIAQIGLGLTLVFAGGAAGKLVCGYLGARFGVLATVILTEGLTAAGILALLPMPLDLGFILLPVIGIGHLVRTVWDRTRAGFARGPHQGLRHLLHRHCRCLRRRPTNHGAIRRPLRGTLDNGRHRPGRALDHSAHDLAQSDIDPRAGQLTATKSASCRLVVRLTMRGGQKWQHA